MQLPARPGPQMSSNGFAMSVLHLKNSHFAFRCPEFTRRKMVVPKRLRRTTVPPGTLQTALQVMHDSAALAVTCLDKLLTTALISGHTSTWTAHTSIGTAECTAAHCLQCPDQVLFGDGCAGGGLRQLSMQPLQALPLSRHL